ncbi:hypothetical protein SAMN05421690_10625 [Nitrosomonas sp. Nm51]|nr:hypothetical protein SAMN05421690_10625 [Nitrosomonas sp. Nm51]
MCYVHLRAQSIAIAMFKRFEHALTCPAAQKLDVFVRKTNRIAHNT